MEKGIVLADRTLAEFCRQYAAGVISMGYILKMMELPPNRAQQAAYKMLVALRREELAKKGIVL